MWSMTIAFLQEQASHHANNDEVSCKWLLSAGGGALSAAIIFLIMWVKALIADNRAMMAERITDLKDHYRSIKKD